MLGSTSPRVGRVVASARAEVVSRAILEFPYEALHFVRHASILSPSHVAPSSMSVCPTRPLDHYQVLGLSSSDARGDHRASKEEIKAAYHRTLLIHHPDKALIKTLNTEPRSKRHNSTTLTIDQITTAYQTLSDPDQRRLYDRRLLQQGSAQDPSQLFKTKIVVSETVDLEDLIYSEQQAVWTRCCRCGADPAFQVSEQQLESEAHIGEVLVDCRGCSLRIRVLFQAFEEDR